jgi:hypothetical protein
MGTLPMSGSVPTLQRMDRRADTIVMRVFCAFMGIGCLALVFTASAAIASGGYRPERYAGGFDPVRAGMLVLFAACTAGFGLVAGGGVVARWSGPDRIAIGEIAFWAGLTIASGATLVILAGAPASSAPFAVPVPLRVALFVGLGLMVAAMVPTAVENSIEAMGGRRGLGILVAVLGFAMFAATAYLLRTR